MPRPETLRVPLRVLFYKEDGDWIAHCLEFDLLGDGATRGEALSCLTQAIALQVQASLEDQNFGNLFSPADSKYFLMFARGTNVVDGVVEIERHQLRASAPIIDEIEAREYEDSASDLALA